jgi:hypothetical protein
MDRDFLAANLLSPAYAVTLKAPLDPKLGTCGARNLQIILPLLLAQMVWSGQLCIGHGHGLRAQGPITALNISEDMDTLM